MEYVKTGQWIESDGELALVIEVGFKSGIPYVVIESKPTFWIPMSFVKLSDKMWQPFTVTECHRPFMLNLLCMAGWECMTEVTFDRAVAFARVFWPDFDASQWPDGLLVLENDTEEGATAIWRESGTFTILYHEFGAAPAIPT